MQEVETFNLFCKIVAPPYPVKDFVKTADNPYEVLPTWMVLVEINGRIDRLRIRSYTGLYILAIAKKRSLPFWFEISRTKEPFSTEHCKPLLCNGLKYDRPCSDRPNKLKPANP